MDREEYSLIARSMVFRALSAFTAALAVSLFAHTKHMSLGIFPAFFLMLIFFFCTGIKFFPASGGWMNLRFRNFRRVQSGLPELPDSDSPKERFLDDYRRG